MNILFLDIDGVLNSYNWIHAVDGEGAPIFDDSDLTKHFDPKACAVLKKILDTFPDLSVVLSSSWRKLGLSLDEINELITSRYTSEGQWKIPFIGMTGVFYPPKMSFFSKCERGIEIQSWLDNTTTTPDGIVIIDDTKDMGQLNKYLVLTSWLSGLLSEDLERVEKILSIPYERPKWGKEMKFLGEDLTSYVRVL